MLPHFDDLSIGIKMSTGQSRTCASTCGFRTRDFLVMRPRLYHWATAPPHLRSAMLSWQKVHDNEMKLHTYHVGRLANLWRLPFDHVFWRNGSWLCCIKLEVFLCFQNWSWRCLWWGRSCLKAWLLASISRRLKNKEKSTAWYLKGLMWVTSQSHCHSNPRSTDQGLSE